MTTPDFPMTVKGYQADGVTLIQEFPGFTNLSILDVFNDVGSFTMSWALNAPGASQLISDTDIQIAVLADAQDGNGFQEINRYFYEQDNYDESMPESAIITGTGRSLLSILENGLVYPKGGLGSTTTSYSFTGASPGNIMHTFITLAQARGCFPGLSMSFTSGQDSSGAAWASGFTYAYSAGTTLLAVAQGLAQSGLCDISMTGLTLNMYNPGTTLARDLSPTVFLRRSRDISSAAKGRDRTQISTAMLTIGDNGANTEVTAGTIGTLGRKESYLGQSGVTDIPTLTAVANQALAAVDDQQISSQPAYLVDPGKGSPIPWKTYRCGDYISLDTTGTGVKYRVHQIAAQCGPGGPTYVQPVLNDVFYDRQVLLQNQVNAMSGGSITGVGISVTGSQPAPGPNPTVPGVPAFVPANIYTAAYYSPATGTTLAQIELAWTTPVNTDGTTMIDGANYIVQYRLSRTPIYPIAWSQLQGKPWSTIQGNPWSNPLDTPQNQQWTTIQVGIDNNTVVVPGLICGETYDFQIACTDVSGNTGLFSAISSFATATDNVAPQQPDAPTVAASMVAVQVMHDLGAASGGTYDLDQDLDHLEVHYSYDPSFTPVAGVGSPTYLGKLIANAGMMAAQIAAVGTFQVTSTTGIFIKVIAVDVSGNVSPPSPGSGVTAVLIDDSHISSLSVSKLVAGTVSASIVLGGVIATALTGQRVQMDSNGLEAYDAGGNQIFSLSDSSPVVVIGANGTSGNSIRLDTSKTFPTLFFNVTGGTQPASISGSLSLYGTGLALSSPSYTSPIDGSSVQQNVFIGSGGGVIIESDSVNGPNGSSITFADTFVSLFFYKQGSAIPGGMFFEANGTYTDVSLVFEGYHDTVASVDPDAYVVFQRSTVGAGSGTVNIPYGVTMASNMAPILQYSCGTTTPVVSLNMSAGGTTSFNATLSTAAPATFAIFSAAYRFR